MLNNISDPHCYHHNHAIATSYIKKRLGKSKHVIIPRLLLHHSSLLMDFAHGHIGVNYNAPAHYLWPQHTGQQLQNVGKKLNGEEGQQYISGETH